MAAWKFQHLLYLLIRSDLDWGFLSEHISGDLYTVGRPAHAHYSLNSRSKIFASKSQLKNALKLIFYKAHISYAPPFILKQFSSDKSNVSYTTVLIDYLQFVYMIIPFPEISH